MLSASPITCPSRYEHILTEPGPVPAYALKLLVAMTAHSPAFTRYRPRVFLSLRIYVMHLRVLQMLKMRRFCKSSI